MKNCGNITGWQLFFLLLITSLMTTVVGAATGAVSVGIVYQELEGFGASGAWYENWLTAHPLKNEIYDVLFGQLGLDIYRVRNTYDQGYAGADYIDNSAEIVAAAKARNPSLKIMISSWSPPGYLKSTGDTHTYNGTLAGGPSNYVYEDYADWWYYSLHAFSNHGIDANYVNIQNEPDFSPSDPEWDSCRFEPSETTSYAGYDTAFEAVYNKLHTEMGSSMPKMLAPETTGLNRAGQYINALDNLSHVYGYAHHLYNCNDGGPAGCAKNPDNYIFAMTSFGSTYNDKPILQTEFSDGTHVTSHDAAMDLAVLIHNALVYEGVSAYLYWDLFWGEPKGLVGLDNPWGANPSYTINPVYYAFKQYAAYTDPGWHRVEASTDSSGLRISAFKSADGTELAIVIINTSGIDINLALSLGCFSTDSSEVYRTSETENTAYIGTFDESQPLALPPQTITTVSLTGSLDCSNCADVRASGYGLTSDISGDDCYVNYKDLKIIADYWLRHDCSRRNNCDGADFEPDDDVDFFDFSTFALQWMQCNDPEDPNCTPNW